MNARPDSSPLRVFLARVARRLSWIAAAEATALGLALAAPLAWLLGPIEAVVAGVGLAALGIVLSVAARRRRPVAELVERRAANCRNIVVTAAELLDEPSRVRPDIGALVFQEADRTVANLDPATLFPARRAVVTLCAGAALLAVSLALVSVRPAASSPRSDAPIDAATISGVDVVVTAPAYSGLPAQSRRDPPRIEALAGSRVQITVNALAAAVTIETLRGQQTLTSAGNGRFVGEIVADADGYVAIEAAASGGRSGARRLIGLAVVPDQAPRVRITAPGRDMFLAEARRPLELIVEADDDLALASLRLHYTKVSGSGERFTFTDGETPLRIVRTDEHNWSAQGSLPLGAMELSPGDVVVYRGVATDRRPGAAPSESDAFIVEITAPGAVASEGFAMDDEMDRYAVSQQMVILKTERLLARRGAISAAAFAEEARSIAAAQRTVRSEFVFMMGGELAEEVIAGVTDLSQLHEEAEAEAGDDILAGRLANRGRIELIQAIRSMSDANAALVDTEVDSALNNERTALEHLQRAFSRTRYILRALTERERLDLSRRLSGPLSEAARDVRPVAVAAANPRMMALRAALAGIASLAGADSLAGDAAERASLIARGVIRVDPSSGPLQTVAARLTDAGAAIARSRRDEARTLLDGAAMTLAAVLRADLLETSLRQPPLDVGRLEGTLTDALRRAESPR